jgi:hypothetical protein
MVFGREPALFLALFGAVVQLALSFGLHLTDVQLAGINAAMFAIVGFAIRQSVTGPPAPPKPPGA